MFLFMQVTYKGVTRGLDRVRYLYKGVTRLLDRVRYSIRV